MLRSDGLHVALADIAPAQLRDPFLQDTLKRIPASLTLAHRPEPEKALANAHTAPAGLIFHVSRCGSTLVSQLLKLQPGLTVYSEPPAFNELLAPPLPESRTRLVGALREVAAMFSLHAGGPYVVKLSSWNLLFCEVLAQAFPQSPWALCLRDPIEVCVSLLARPPGWLKQPSSPLTPYFIRPEGAKDLAPEERVATAFASFCAAAERLAPSRGLIVNYEDLPDATWESVLPGFGLQADTATVERMRAASRVDAKAPVEQARAFHDDAGQKRGSASADLRAAVQAIARPALESLLARLRATSPPR